MGLFSFSIMLFKVYSAKGEMTTSKDHSQQQLIFVRPSHKSTCVPTTESPPALRNYLHKNGTEHTSQAPSNSRRIFPSFSQERMLVKPMKLLPDRRPQDGR